MRGSEGTAKFSLPLLPVVPRISSLSVQGGNLPEREVRGRGREARKTLKRMVVLVSRHGRRLQRYSSGRRLVVGCIPYKLKEVDEPCSEDTEPAIEVLVVSSQKGPELMFPKGGWELDESMPEAASREAFEEAGVRGSFEGTLGKWTSKGDDKIHFMYALRVTEVLQQWPEMDARERKWVSKKQASHADPTPSTVSSAPTFLQ
ncbi:Nudix hydrolase [Musa troglodytarum]|uniref:Nudix hydrolase n=1 Tax=Musa troglodytarum TaxID=320322 RepID=A0A9E7JUI4_9LILI|nr:Nudix hydrolase [Musa troglodytarum]